MDNGLEDDGKFTMSDLIRSTLNVNSLEEMTKAFEMINTMEELNVIRIKSKLTTDLQNVTLNVIYMDMIIGEIQIRFGPKPANFYAKHFLYELTRCDKADQFRQQVLIKMDFLSENELILMSKVDENDYVRIKKVLVKN